MKQTIIDAVKNADGQKVHFSQLVTWDAFATREQVQAEPFLSIDEHDFVHYVSPKETVKEVVAEDPVSVSSSHNTPVEVEVTDEERQAIVDSNHFLTRMIQRKLLMKARLSTMMLRQTQRV